MSDIAWEYNKPIPITLIIREGAIGIIGQSPTIEIRRKSDNKYFDWISNLFVNSGGQKENILPSAAYQDGVYESEWNPRSYGEKNEETYILLYRNTGDYARFGMDKVFVSLASAKSVKDNIMQEFVVATSAVPARNILPEDLNIVRIRIKRPDDADFSDPIESYDLLVSYQTTALGTRRVHKVGQNT